VINAATTSDKQTVAKLEYYSEHNKLELLANPQLTTRSGIKLHVYFGDTYNIPTFNPTTGALMQNVPILAGTDVTVTPVVGADGRISITADGDVPSVSTMGPDGFPVTTDRKFTVAQSGMVDGQSMIISGYKYTSTQDDTSGDSILMKLPLVGNLFKTRSLGACPSNVWQAGPLPTPPVRLPGIATAR
jgi:Flp pilus assembly secretin CpaC